MKKYVIEHAFLFFVLIVASLLFYVMNTLVPFFSDDLNCVYVEGRRIANITDFLASLRNDYLYINGRLIIDGAVLAVILLGENVFNVINTLLFGVAIVLFFRQIGISGDAFHKTFFLILTLIGFLSLSTGVDSLFYWAAGASNYLWALIPTLLFMGLMKTKERVQGKPLLLLFVAGLLLSAYNEMYSFHVCAAYLSYFVFHRKELTRSQLGLLCGFVVGSLFMAFAPGNFLRQTSYTFGLGALSRLVKMMYSLRLTYLLLLVVAVAWSRNREILKAWWRENTLLLLMLAYSFVIPFLAAQAFRAMFCTEVIALLLSLRLLKLFSLNSVHVKVLAIVSSLLLFAFQTAQIHASHLKWGIYRTTVNTYLHQESPTVIIDDYQCSTALMEYYTVNLDNIFTPNDKAQTLAREKYLLQGRPIGEEGADSLDYIRILPQQVYDAAIVNHADFFVPERRIEGVGFYHSDNLVYDIMPYDAEVLRAVYEGRFYAEYELPCLKWTVRINYLSSDVGFERAVMDHQTAYGHYILLNRKYKHYPLLQLRRFGLHSSEPRQKIEILR